MSTVEVKLPTASYNIQIQSGLMSRLGYAIRSLSSSKKAVIITDENVRKLYGRRITNLLKEVDLPSECIEIKPGEGSKNLDCFSEIIRKTADIGTRKDHLIIAFGGGVVGDIAGFAAAVYMRGLPYIHIPTTLLAQVDSSVGGKTGIDLPQGKNLLGAFHQPLGVMIDPDLLITLNDRQLAEGMAEIIKYGAISDGNLFEELEGYGGTKHAFGHLSGIIHRCCGIKAGIVERDEKDSGERRKLNFGHSFGHAIEKLGGYQSLSHGEAVSIGMCLAAEVGEKLGVTAKGTKIRISKILNAYNLPTLFFDKVKDPDYSELVEAMGMDKKNQGDDLKLVLLNEIGNSIICDISESELLTVLSG